MAYEEPREPQAYRERPRRRYGRAILLVAALFAAGYWLSPHVAVARLALAAQAGAPDAVLRRVDLPQVRASFARQIVRAYMARNPPLRGLDPLSRNMVGNVASGYVNAIISEHLTPEAIAGLLAGRSRSDVAEILPGGAALLRLDRLGAAWDLFRASGFTGPASFAVAVPTEAGPDRRFGLRFGLSGTSWLLRAIILPEAALSRFADELKARLDRGS